MKIESRLFPPQTMSKEDYPREEMDGRSRGDGSWLENKLAETLSEWGYRTIQGESLLGLEVDVLARKEEMCDEPEDFIVAECKDWSSRRITEDVVIRLCLTAYVARAMPVLCHTTKLTTRAWKLAQKFDVRILSVDQLDSYDDMPPLTYHRPPLDREPHCMASHIDSLRSHLPFIITRWGLSDVEAAAFSGGRKGPYYVTDREGHRDYVQSHLSDFDFST